MNLRTAVFTSDNSEDKLLLSKISDAIDLSVIRRKTCYVGFLNEGQVYKAEEFLHNTDFDCCFWGGYNGAKRKMFCALYGDFREADVPLCAVELEYRAADKLSHRDFLGSLMSLGIERDAVGDILTSEGRTVVFLKNEIKPYICSQLTKVGGTGVKIFDADLTDLPEQREPSEKQVTVASLRADAVISALTGLSREKSQRLISQGLVLVNYSQCFASDKKLSDGNVITARGYGKFILKSINGETKKGRLKLSVQLFR